MTTKTERKHPIVSAALASILMLACGEVPNEPATPDLSGTWRYAATVNPNEPVSCEIGATVVLLQDGSAFDGVMSEGRLTCSVFSDTVMLGALPVVDGIVREDSVSFRFETLGGQWSHRGQLWGDTVGGVVTFSPSFICDLRPCDAVVGTWGAGRVSR